MESLEDIIKRFFQMMKDGTKSIERTEVWGLIISSCLTPDCGYETAIIDANEVYVVERYKNEEDCKKGHKRWCKLAKTIATIKPLGWIGLTEDSEEEIMLERNFDVNFK